MSNPSPYTYTSFSDTPYFSSKVLFFRCTKTCFSGTLCFRTPLFFTEISIFSVRKHRVITVLMFLFPISLWLSHKSFAMRRRWVNLGNSNKILRQISQFCTRRRRSLDACGLSQNFLGIATPVAVPIFEIKWLSHNVGDLSGIIFGRGSS